MALFQELKDTKLDPDIAIYNILITGLCNNGKLSIARELFYSLASKGLQPNVPTYNIMIKGLCKEGLIDEAGELLEKMDGNESQELLVHSLFEVHWVMLRSVVELLANIEEHKH
uniref:Pentatricopeptide repeat-containing protein n=1 Tax=Quercus lobata TaxID=97700 RepID=A0A7N2KXN4_QUELO